MERYEVYKQTEFVGDSEIVGVVYKLTNRKLFWIALPDKYEYDVKVIGNRTFATDRSSDIMEEVLLGKIKDYENQER